MRIYVRWGDWPPKYRTWLLAWEHIYSSPQSLDREDRWSMIRSAHQEFLNDRYYLDVVRARR